MAKYKCKACESMTEGGVTAPVTCPNCHAKFKMVKIAEGAAAEQAAPLRPAPRLPEVSPSPRQAERRSPDSQPREQPPVRSVARSETAPSQPPRPVSVVQEPAPRRREEPLPKCAAIPERVVWRYPDNLPMDTANHPLRNCPAVDACGRVFVVVQDRLAMFADDGLRTGSPSWEYSLDGQGATSPVVGPDGNVRVHAGNGYLHVVNASGQRVADPICVGKPLGWTSPTVDQQNNTLICGCHGGLLRAGADKPYFRTSQQFDCTGFIRGDVLYVGGGDNCIYAIRLGPQAENVWDHSKGLGCASGALNSPLALAGGTVLVAASRDNRLRGFDLAGSVVWEVGLPGQSLGAPVVDADGTIFVGISQNRGPGDNRGMLISLDVATHEEKWRYATDAPVESTPVIGDDGIVYFGDNGGGVHAVDCRGGKIWSENVGVEVRSPGTVLCSGLLAFGADDGRLVAFRCSSHGLRPKAWPKFRGTAEQNGLVT